MAVIKCKMCGGELELVPGSTVAECEYCGSRQTVPSADSDKKLTLFSRANRLRAACEFDKAAGIYETIAAEFAEEAEAYWGLVLCKYGIEYVDDPATGRKIPTCHRSSFDSVMEDPNLEQTLENADVVARKVYRDEAKQIEEIRKGIIAVSNNEEPYDIFICYKESAEDGQRTLDSVLAQDIYDALTDKGYRTFFARITLEDKIGQEYEPFIFAALNSAKIMLAVGTDYEYYNAVWVKNEWSRYLKLMEADKSKHLIPCFKGIDAYDMPKEFNRLQAQDLGKVGAMQDLMRGIEKLLPKAKPVVEQVVVNTGYANNVTALLKRGQMALEDGQWGKADEFFEEVLNQNAECAEAYLGKVLAAEKCVSLPKLADHRLASTQSPTPVKKEIQKDNYRITSAIQTYTLPGYLNSEEIKKLFQYPDYTYPSYIASREKQLADERKFWETNRNLSRAMQFSKGEFKAELTAARDRVLTAMEERVQKANESLVSAKENKLKGYKDFLDKAEEKAKALNLDAQAKKKAHYEEQAGIANNSQDMEMLRSAEKALKQLGDYEDSMDLARKCMSKISALKAEADRLAAEAKAKADAEAAAAAKAKAEEKAKATKKAITIGIIAVVVIIAIVAVSMVLTKVIIPNGKLNDAQELLDAGQYQEAYGVLTDLGDYKNSAELMDKATEKGRYLVTSWTVDEHYLDENCTYVYTYNSNGLPLRATLTYTEASGKDTAVQLIEFQYTYFPNGRIETCTVIYNGVIRAYMEFYDVEENGFQFGDYKQAEYSDVKSAVIHGFRFYGVYKHNVYNTNGEIQFEYEYPKPGDPIELCTFTYNDDGSIAHRIYDKNGDGDGHDFAESERYYHYVYENGRLSDWIYSEDREGEDRTYRETFSYDAVGNVTTHHWWYASDSTLKLGGKDTFVWEWVDYAQSEAAAQEILDNHQQFTQQAYADAEALLATGDYEAAQEAFEKLGDYEDSVQAVTYCEALQWMEKQNYEKAYEAFASLGDYRDTSTYLKDFVRLPSSIEKENANETVEILLEAYNGMFRASAYVDSYTGDCYTAGQTIDLADFWVHSLIDDGSEDISQYADYNEFDEYGRLVKRTDVNGNYSIFEYTYNDDGTVKRRTETSYNADFNGRDVQQGKRIVDYTYNADGQVSQTIDSTYYSYDDPSYIFDYRHWFDTSTGEIVATDMILTTNQFSSGNLTGKKVTEETFRYTYSTFYIPALKNF